MADNFRNPLDAVIKQQQTAATSLREGLAQRQATRQPSGLSALSSSTPSGDLLPPAELRGLFEQTASQYDVPVNILAGLAQQESSYDANAVGVPTKYGQAKGLMQYIDPTAKAMGIDPTDPAQAINAAAKQFRERLDKGYSVQEAIAAHHGGDDRAQWGPKTKAYVESVMGKAGSIGAGWAGKSGDLQSQLDAEAPGRYKVMDEGDLAQYQRRADLMQGGEGLGDAMEALAKPDAPSPLTLENQQAQPGVNPPSPLTIENQMLAKRGLPAKDTRPYQDFTEATGNMLGNVPERFQQSIAGLIQLGAEDLGLERERYIADRARQYGMTPGDMKLLAWAAQEKLIDEQMPAPEALQHVKANIAQALNPEQLEQLSASGLINPQELATFAQDWRKQTKETETEVRAEPGSLAFYGSAAIGSLAEMTPMLAAAALTRNPTLAMGIMSGQVGGQSYAEGRDKGLGEEEAQTYAVLTTAAEVVPEGLVIGRLLKPGGSILAKALEGSVLEGLQEGVTGALQAGIDQQMISPDMTLDEALVRIRDSAIIGGMTGGGMGVVGGVAGKMGQRQSQPIEAPERIEPTLNEADMVAEAPANEPTLSEADVVAEAPVVEPPLGPLQRAVAKAVPTGERVVVQTIAGPVEGSLEHFTEDGKGGWSAKVMTDDGQLYQYTDKDGVELAPAGAEQVAEPLPAEQENAPGEPVEPVAVAPEPVVAEQEAVASPQPVEQPAEPVAAELAPKVEPAQLDEPQLREQLKYLAGQAKRSGGWSKGLMAERKKIERAIDALQTQPESQVVQDFIDGKREDAPTLEEVERERTDAAPVKSPIKPHSLVNPRTPEQLKELTEGLKNPELKTDDMERAHTEAEALVAKLSGKTSLSEAQERKLEKARQDVEHMGAELKRRHEVMRQERSERYKREEQERIDAMPEDLVLMHIESLNQDKRDYQINPERSVYKDRDAHYVDESLVQYRRRLEALGYQGEKLEQALQRRPAIPLPKPGDKFTFGEGKATVLEASEAGIKIRKRGKEQTLAVSQYHANLYRSGELPQAELDRIAKLRPDAEQATVKEETPAQPVKWFGSQERADAFIAKKGLQDSHEVVLEEKRYEIREKAQPGVNPPLTTEVPVVVEAPDVVPYSRKLVRTYTTKSGKVGAEVRESLGRDGRLSYSYSGEWGAGSVDADTMRKHEASWKADKRGFTVEEPGQAVEQPKAEESQLKPGARVAIPVTGQKGVIEQIKGDRFIVRIDNSNQLKPFAARMLKVTQAAPERVDMAKWPGVPGEAVEAAEAKPAADGHTVVGRRADGVMIRQDDRGVRFYAEGGARIFETVSLVPTRDGMRVERKELKPEFMTAEESAAQETAPAVKEKPADVKPVVDTVKPSANTVFTEDAAEKARALIRSKLTQLNSGFDPELMQAGITLAGYHIEKGARTFSAYAKAMTDDLGELITPYLKSWYMGVKYDPRASGFDGMSSAAEVEAYNIDEVQADEQQAASGIEPATAAGAPSDRALEGTPTDDVPAAEGGRDAERESAGGGGNDARGNGGSDGAGLPVGSGVGSGAGAVRVPAAGGRGKRGSAGKRGLPDDAGNAKADQSAVKHDPQATTDYRITDLTRLGEGGQKTKYRNNVEAIRLVGELQESGRQATPAEQDVMARYVGWGGLAQAFDANNKEWAKEHAELRELLSEEEWAAANESTQYAHYTSQEIIGGMYDALRHLGFTGGRLVEPGAGVGNFMGLMPEDMRGASRFTAVERERIAGGIAKALYPGQNVQLEDFRRFNAQDGYFDVALGNPPFASTTLTDLSGRKHLSGLSIHNYFFAKSVDMLRDGGLLAMVVSNSFMDAKGDKARRYIGERTELLGAVRLPNKAFSKNANTEVTTDIIFLRKRPESEWGGKAAKESMQRWMMIESVADPLGGERIPLNRYFVENPGMLLGQMKRAGSMYGPGQPALIAREGQDTAALMQAAIKRLPQGVYESSAVKATSAMQEAAVVALSDKATVDVGGHYVDDGKLLVRLDDVAGEGRAVQLTPDTLLSAKRSLGEKGVNRLKALAELRVTVRQLLAAEMSDGKGIDALRQRMNEQYDGYVAEYGYINQRATIQLFGEDPDFPLLASLEHGFDPGIGAAAAKSQGVKAVAASAKKGPIFSRRVIERNKPITTAESPHDALMVSIAERGQIDAGYIGELLGRDGAEVLQELSKGDKPELFVDPAVGGYALRDAYLSGNVRKKLKQAQAAGLFVNVEALERVVPEDIPAHEISAKIGAPWVPAETYAAFATEIMGEGTKARVVYVPAMSSYVTVFNPGSDVENANTYGTDRMGADEIYAALLNSRDIKVGHYEDDPVTRSRRFVLEKDKTDEANDKAREIRDKFADWLFADADRSEQMQRAYNDAVNNYVTRLFDGSAMRFPGKVPDAIIKLRRHQRNAVARILQDGRGLLDHVVGAGKTFTVIAAAMELKRTGLAQKPIIAVPNHLVKQWAADFYRLYPGANILTATKKDFEKANRRKFLAKIATGNWDAVIIAHSSFGFIKPDPAFEARFNRDRINEVVEAMEALADEKDSSTKRTVKQLAKMKEGLENKLASLRDKPMDGLLDFAQLGTDMLFVDEAHLFKNLMYVTKMQNVRGLSQAKGSQRAYDMFIKTHQLYEQNGGGRGVVFATGTPISNSLAEMYHMLRYLAPETLKDANQFTFDAWAKTFADVEQVWMQSMSGDGYKASNRMSKFVNTPELLRVYDQVADTVTMEHIKEAYAEENSGAAFPIPPLKGGRRLPVSIPRSQAQTDYMASIGERAKALEKRKGKPQKGDDNMLSIMADARKAAMDIRMVDPDVTQRDPEGRLAIAANKVFERYQRFNAVRGTQLIFSDMGTPKKHAEKELKEYNELAEQAAPLQDEQLQAMADLGDESAIEAIEKAEEAQRKIDAKGQDWLDAIKAAQRGFSIYDDLKEALVEKGVPENEIAFIHDHNTDDQKAALFRAVNDGKVRVLLGSTEKMGAGTNVQERLVALHHIDVPWKPSDIEQREGRIVRQGNVLIDPKNADFIEGFEVEVMAYATQDTLDLFMWQTQEKKLAMIAQLREGNVGRDVDNAFEEMQMSAGEMQAAATSNPFLMEEIQLKEKVKRLERQKRSFDGQKNDLVSRARKAERQLTELPPKIKAAQRIEQAAKAAMDAVAEHFAKKTATVNGQTITGAKQIREAVLELVREAPTEEKAGKEVKAISIELNGKTYTAVSTLNDAMIKAVGNAAQMMMTLPDGTVIERGVDAVAPITDSLEALDNAGVDQIELGRIGDFELIASQLDGSKVDVSLMFEGNDLASLAEVDTSDVLGIGEPLRHLLSTASNIINNQGGNASYLQSQLERAERAKADLDGRPDLGEWQGEAELKAARGQHREILKKLGETAEEAAPEEAAGEVSLSVNNQRQGGTAASLGALLRSGPLGKLMAKRIDEGKVVLHDTAATIPHAGGSRSVGGLTNIDGVIHLNAERLTARNAMSVALHEAFHAGTHPLLGTKDWDKLLADLGALRNQAARGGERLRALHAAATARVAFAEQARPLSQAKKNEEFGAYLIEEYNNLPAGFKSWVDTLLGQVKAWARRVFGVQLGQVTPEQLHALALMALRSDSAMGAEFELSAADSLSDDLAAILAMDEDAYIRAVNPSGKRLDPDDRMILNVGDLSAPGDAVRIGQFSDKQGRNVQILRDADGSMYARQGGEVLAMVSALEDNETVVEVVEQAKGQGIGSNLMKAYIKENPLAQSGGFTEGGEATRRAALRKLKAEQPSFAILPEATALEDALAALDDTAEQFKPDYVGGLVKDMGMAAKFTLHPRQIAALHKDFAPVYTTANSQFEMRDSIIDEFQQDHFAYDNLSNEGKGKVNAVLELGRLLNATYPRAELEGGVVNPGSKSVVKFTEGGSTYRAKEPIHALLSKSSEIITLSQEEATAYLSLRKMFDAALDKFKDQTLEDFGFPELVGKKNAAELIVEMTKQPSFKKDRPQQIERLMNIAKFILEIEQAKRAGYVPFARYGNYVVTVKEQQFPMKIIKDPDGGWLTRDLPTQFDDFLKSAGAAWNELEGGYELNATQRQALIKENERTVHSAKVEFTLQDKALLKLGRKVEELPSVKKALAEAEKWKDGRPDRRIVAFEAIQKQADGGVKLADVDALAEVAMLDTDTWDAVRDQLADAIKGQSFRKHFFQSQNVPGYTADFERSIADYMGGMAGYLSRRHFNKQWDNAIGKVKAPRLFEYANKYRAYVNEPQEELAMLRQIGFLYYIAGVPATAMVNLTQPFLMTIPALGQFAKVPLVLKEMTQAYRDVLKMTSMARGLEMFDPSKAPADVRGILQEAWAGGMFVPLQTYEIMATARHRNVGSRRFSRYFTKGTQAVAFLFSYAERLNRLVTFIASARLLGKPGVAAQVRKVLGANNLARQTVLKELTPLSFADFMIDETQFRMGKANRPMIMRGVGAGIMQFKGFVMQSLEAWFRWSSQNGKEGAKAVASSLLAMVILGGLWGFPGADDLRELIEKAYRAVTGRDLDMKSELREQIHAMTGQRWLSEVATKGATFPLGLDTSRVGMGGIAPDTPLQVFGIPADLIVGRGTRAAGKVAQGEYLGAASELLPNFAKNIGTAIDWKTGGLRNSYGQKILDQSEVTGTMAAMRAVGFQPSKVTNVRDYEYAQRRRETAVDQIKRRFVSSLAKAYAEAERYPEKRDEVAAKVAEINARIDAHNNDAEGEEELIRISKTALRNRVALELQGVSATWGKERKQARGVSERMREVYDLEGE